MFHWVCVRSRVLVALVVLFPCAANAQNVEANGTPARTAGGQPDISGTFTFRTLTPLSRPAALADRETLSLEEAAAFEASERTRLNRDLYDPETGQPSAGYQSRAEGGVLSYNEFWYERGVELTSDKRTSLVVDPPDGRVPFTAAYTEQAPLNRLNIRNGFGDSRGHWDGDTLVVETLNFLRETSLGGSMADTRLTERFRRVDADTVVYEFTVEDANSYTRPWTAMVPFRRTDGPLYEYACHEGNVGLHGILAGARRQNTQAVDRRR